MTNFELTHPRRRQQGRGAAGGGGKHTVQYGTTTIGYELERDGRKLLQIAVHPAEAVVVTAPLDASDDAVAERVRRRAAWILRQVRFFQQFRPRTPERRFVAGESHLYLGRAYRLKLDPGFGGGVELVDGWFRVPCGRDDHERARRLMDRWFRERALELLPGMVERHWERLRPALPAGCGLPVLALRRMRTRWGSLSARGRLTINPALLGAPMECIEYVVVHELCHLRHPRHDRAFRTLLRRTLPDHLARKQRLERTLS